MADKFSRIISADSHVMEPAAIYEKGLDKRFGNRSPRLMSEYLGKKGTFFFSGDQVLKLRQVDEQQRAKGADPAYGYDPVKRIEFLDKAGVEAEVIYATLLSMVMHAANIPENREMCRAACQLFNDWMADFCSVNPKRLLGVGAITTDDPKWAASEIDRMKKKGLRGVVINTVPPDGCAPYRHPSYEPVWSAAEANDMPVTLHIVTGKVRDFAHVHSKEENEAAPGWMFDLFSEVKVPLANDFIFGGILDRHEKLKLICSEFEVNWVPSFMWGLDQLEGPFSSRVALPRLKMRASEYMRTRVWHGIIDDPFGDQAIGHIGASQVCWGSDFPHVRSIGTNAQSFVADLFKNLLPATQEQVVGLNAAKLYGIV